MTPRPYTFTEELWHCFLHGLGFILSLAGISVLVAFAVPDMTKVLAAVIFGVSMAGMYGASTLYHAVPSAEAKKLLKKIDHIAIYYLIAGTYTPFTLVNLAGPTGYTLLAVIWGLAFLGTALKLSRPVNGARAWSIGLYLLMGWLIVAFYGDLAAHTPALGLKCLILGGLFYTIGVVFYVQKSRAYTHALWHGFVVLGTIAHFCAVLWGVILREITV